MRRRYVMLLALGAIVLGALLGTGSFYLASYLSRTRGIAVWPFSGRGGAGDKAGKLTVTTSTVTQGQRRGRWITYSGGKVLSATFADDVLWVGTTGGAVAYDTRTGETVKYDSSDGLLGNRVESLSVDPAGRVWMATPYGLSRFDGSNWVRYEGVYADYPEGWSGPETHNVAVAPDGSIWCAGGTGVAAFDGRQWTEYGPEHGLATAPIADLAVDAKGNTWVVYAQQPIEEGLAEPIGTGVSVFDGNVWRTWHAGEDNELLDDRITAIDCTPDGQVWALSRLGLNVFDGEDWQGYEALGQFAAAQTEGTSYLCVGPQQPVYYLRHEWLGPLVFDQGRWRQLQPPVHPIRPLVCDKDGRLWCGAGEKLFAYDQQSWRKIDVYGDTIVLGNISDVEVDAEGVVWVVEDQGEGPQHAMSVYSFDGTRARKHDPGQNGGSEVWDIAMGPLGAMWVAVGADLMSFYGGEWHREFRAPVGSTGAGIRGYVTDIGFDDSDRVYCRTSDAVYRYEDGEWRKLTAEDQPQERVFDPPVVDPTGRQWSVAAGGGIAAAKGRDVVVYGVRDGLADNQVNDIAVDPQGRIWMATASGLTVFSPQASQAAQRADDTTERGLPAAREVKICDIVGQAARFIPTPRNVVVSPDCTHVGYVYYDPFRAENVISLDGLPVGRIDPIELAVWCPPGTEGSFYETDAGQMYPQAKKLDLWWGRQEYSALSFSPGGRHLGWVAATRKRGEFQGFVPVIDGQPQRPMNGATAIELPHKIAHMVWSPDGERLAYQAEWPEGQADPNPAVILDGEVVATEYDAAWNPTFSPDGTHFACCVRSGGASRIIVDGSPLADEWDGTVHAPRFSEDGDTIAHIVDTGTHSFVIRRGVHESETRRAHRPVFRWVQRPPVTDAAGNSVAFVVPGGALFAPETQSVAVDGDKQRAYRYVDELLFSPSGRHLAYVGWRGEDDAVTVQDGRPTSQWWGAGGLTYHPTAEHLAYVAGWKHWQYLVVNDRARHMNGVWAPGYSSDGRYLAYTLGVWADADWDREGSPPRNKPNYLWGGSGKHFADRVGVYRWGLGPEYDTIYDYCFDGSVLRYVARNGDGIYQVEHTLE